MKQEYPEPSDKKFLEKNIFKVYTDFYDKQ